tara:strand:+ start:18 stop:284 length:267 start_codon:yes stop_codon:yes gene_type:complete
LILLSGFLAGVHNLFFLLLLGFFFVYLFFLIVFDFLVFIVSKKINLKNKLDLPNLSDSLFSHLILFDIMSKQFNLKILKNKKTYFPIS